MRIKTLNPNTPPAFTQLCLSAGWQPLVARPDPAATFTLDKRAR
jgi:hypothetical protein